MPQSAGGFGHRGVSGLVRLGAGLTVAGHAHQDDAPIAFAQHVVTEIPLLQGAGPEVLDDDVGLLDEVQEELAPLGRAQVQRRGLLVAGVDRPEEVVPVEFGLTPGAQRVWGAGWLDLDDLGAHVAQQSSGERSRDQRADLDDPDAVERAGHGHLAQPVPVQPVRADSDGLAQRVALVGARVIVVGPGDFVHLLVRMADGLEEPPGVARRARVVGQVADHQRRHRDVGPAVDRVAVGVVVAPLREPAAQRAEPRQSDGAVVHHLRITQVAGAGGAIVRVDCRIQPARVGHGAVYDERELVVRTPGRLQFSQFFLDPLGDSPVPCDLRIPVAVQELLRVRRLVRVVRVVEVEFGIALGGIGLVEDRGVHPLGHGAVAADVRGQQHDRVGGDQPKRGQVGAVTGRARGDGRVLRLLLVEHRQRSAAAPAGQHHLGVAEPVLGVLDALAEVLDDLLHEQCGVGAAEAAVAVDDVMPAAGEPVDHRQVRAAPDGVHEDQHGIRRLVLGLEQIALQHDQFGDAAVDVAHARGVLVGNEIRDALVLVLDGRLRRLSALINILVSSRKRSSVFSFLRASAHQCCPRSLASTSSDGTSRRRVSMAMTDHSTLS